MVDDLAFDPATDDLVFSPDTDDLALNCHPWAKYKLTPCYKTICTHFCVPAAAEYYAVAISGVMGCDCRGGLIGRVKTLPQVGECYFFIKNIHDGSDYCLWDIDSASCTNVFPYKTYSDAACEHETASLFATIANCYLQRTHGAWDLEVVAASGNIRPFHGHIDTSSTGGCDGVLTFNNTVDCNWSAGVNWIQGQAILIPGSGIGRCPGGSAIYTNTDLSAYVNPSKAVLIAGVCYLVSVNTDAHLPDGDVTVTASYNTCPLCCAG